MVTDTGITAFSAPEPFGEALRNIRTAVERCRLRIVGELDVSRRVEKALGMRLPPCRILYCWPDPTLAAQVPPEAATVLPLHLVISGHGTHTRVGVPGGKTGTQWHALTDTHVELIQALKSLAMRTEVN